MNSFDKVNDAQAFLTAKKVPKIPAKPRTRLQRQLRDLYAQGGAESALATIINVAMKQHRGAFLVTRATIEALVRLDPNNKVRNFSAHYSRTLLLLSKIGTFPLAVDRKAQVFIFNPDVLAAMGIDGETANGQLQQCISGLTKKAKSKPETKNQPQQLDEVTEIAEAVFEKHGFNEDAWDSEIENHPQYEEIREILKVKRNQSQKLELVS